MATFNHHGFPFLRDVPPANMSHRLATDASDIGFGGHYGNNWFSYPWLFGEKHIYPIFYRELFAVICAVSTWGDRWSGQIIHFFCDSTNSILAAKTATSRNKSMMHLLRHLHSLLVKYKFHIWFEYINTKKNKAADLLSKNKVKQYKFMNPHSNALPSPLLCPLPEHYSHTYE